MNKAESRTCWVCDGCGKESVLDGWTYMQIICRLCHGIGRIDARVR